MSIFIPEAAVVKKSLEYLAIDPYFELHVCVRTYENIIVIRNDSPVRAYTYWHAIRAESKVPCTRNRTVSDSDTYLKIDTRYTGFHTFCSKMAKNQYVLSKATSLTLKLHLTVGHLRKKMLSVSSGIAK